MGAHANFYNSEDGDRIYDAESFTEWLNPFFTTGVFNGGLQVTADENMNIKVSPGYVNIGGKTRYFEQEQGFTLETADATLNRIDSVIIRRDDVGRDITMMVVKGFLSSNPVAPTPVRTNGTYDLVIAHISVNAAAVEILQQNITDTRMDQDICGWVAATVKEIDFSQITAQWENYLETFEADNLDEFNTWFNSIKADVQEILQDGTVINDESTGNITTWSSSKIVNEFYSKEESEDLFGSHLIQNILLTSSGFAANTDEYSSYYPFKYDYQIAGMDATCWADVTYTPEAEETGVMADKCSTQTGLLRFYALEQPSENINIANVRWGKTTEVNS